MPRPQTIYAGRLEVIPRGATRAASVADQLTPPDRTALYRALDGYLDGQDDPAVRRVAQRLGFAVHR